MAYFGVIFFANMGGGGGQNYSHQFWREIFNFFNLWALRGLDSKRVKLIKTRKRIKGTLNTQTPKRASKNPVWFPEGS